MKLQIKIKMPLTGFFQEIVTYRIDKVDRQLAQKKLSLKDFSLKVSLLFKRSFECNVTPSTI